MHAEQHTTTTGDPSDDGRERFCARVLTVALIHVDRARRPTGWAPERSIHVWLGNTQRLRFRAREFLQWWAKKETVFAWHRGN